MPLTGRFPGASRLVDLPLAMTRPRRPSAILLLCFFAACLASGAPACAAEEATDQARSLLQRMDQALAHVPFEGTIVYAHDNDLSALRITHRVQRETPQESLLSLTGPVRAMSRHWKGVTCMLPDAKPLNVRRPAHLGSLRPASVGFEQVERHYDLLYQGGFRIAGRDTDVVAVLPRDDYRYGQRFYVDRESGLPLKIDLLGADGKQVQQVMFTDIDIGLGADASPVVADRKGPEGLARSPIADAVAKERIDTPTIHWQPRELPPGFSVVSRAPLEPAVVEGADAAQGQARQLLVSDGVASFSIYIEPPLDGALQGESRLGAVSAAGGRMGDYQVTVVGEVPPKTARFVLSRGIRPADASASR